MEEHPACYFTFFSPLKVLLDMGPPISKEVQLISFHTVSKGYLGECGQRGGYFEMTNIPPQVRTLPFLDLLNSRNLVNEFTVLPLSRKLLNPKP